MDFERTPPKKRGPKPIPYRTSWGEEIHGLSRLPDGRWRVRSTVGREIRFTEPNERFAVDRFRAMLAEAQKIPTVKGLNGFAPPPVWANRVLDPDPRGLWGTGHAPDGTKREPIELADGQVPTIEDYLPAVAPPSHPPERLLEMSREQVAERAAKPAKLPSPQVRPFEPLVWAWVREQVEHHPAYVARQLGTTVEAVRALLPDDDFRRAAQAAIGGVKCDPPAPAGPATSTAPV